MLTFCYCKQARPVALFSLSRHQECYADINGSFPRQNISLGELQFLAKGVDALLQQTALLRPLAVTQLLFLHLPLQTNHLRGVPLLKTTCGIYVLLYTTFLRVPARVGNHANALPDRADRPDRAERVCDLVCFPCAGIGAELGMLTLTRAELGIITLTRAKLGMLT